MARSIRCWLSLVVAAAILLPSLAAAQGVGGAPRDRLSWPGSPTDRYLEPDEVRAVLHEATDAFYECFNAHVRGGVDVGETSVTLTVARDGSPTAVSIEGGLGVRAVPPCLKDVSEGLQFGDHDGDPLEISYPIVYQVDARRGARILPYPVVFTRPRPIRLPLLSLPIDFSAGEVRMLEKIFTEDLPSEDSAPEGADSAEEPQEPEPAPAVE